MQITSPKFFRGINCILRNVKVDKSAIFLHFSTTLGFLVQRVKFMHLFLLCEFVFDISITKL